MVGSKMAALLLLSAFAFASCSKDDEPTAPAFVGTWQADASMYQAPLKVAKIISDYRDLLILTESTYSQVSEIQYEGSTAWIAEDGEKGSLSASGDVITITSKQVAVTLYDADDNTIGVKYDDMLPDERTTSKAKWKVVNNTITLNVDDDGDGIYDGANDFELIYNRL